MGVVVPFKPKAVVAQEPGEGAVLAALGTGEDRATILFAARPLLAHFRDRYGFVVLRDGLPKENAVLVQSLMQLSRALRTLDPVVAKREPTWAIGVCLNGAELAWLDIDDDAGGAINVPSDVEPADFERFVRPRLPVVA